MAHTCTGIFNMPTKFIIAYTTADLDTMARTLWAEARGEPLAGQVAVASVILNRALRPAFAHDLAGAAGAVARVCKAPWQFSCWNHDDPNRPLIAPDPYNEREMANALKWGDYGSQRSLAAGVLEARTPDNTNGADMYYAPQGMDGVVPDWAAKCKQTAVIGHQIFFDSRKSPTDDVARAQVALAALGYYYGQIDNDAGPKTRAAVIAYQTAKGLFVDGVLGPITLTSLGVT
jgi:N-acetylmuramoyl-L-alanine amidase